MAKVLFNVKCQVCTKVFGVSQSSSELGFIGNLALWLETHNTCEQLEKKFAEEQKAAKEVAELAKEMDVDNASGPTEPTL